MSSSSKKVDNHTYLVVGQQSSLKWDCHINRITSTATQRLAQLWQILKHANTPTIKIAYQSLIRPLREYASQVWDPHQKSQINQFERDQNKSLRFIYSIKGQVSFTQLRADVEIMSLRERRKEARLSLFTKCIAEGIEPSITM